MEGRREEGRKLTNIFSSLAIFRNIQRLRIHKTPTIRETSRPKQSLNSLLINSDFEIHERFIRINFYAIGRDAVMHYL